MLQCTSGASAASHYNCGSRDISRAITESDAVLYTDNPDSPAAAMESDALSNESDALSNTDNQDLSYGVQSDAVQEILSVDMSIQQILGSQSDEDTFHQTSLARDVLHQLKSSALSSNTMISVPVGILINILNLGTCMHLLCHIIYSVQFLLTDCGFFRQVSS